jgi:hypothetical protein
MVADGPEVDESGLNLLIHLPALGQQVLILEQSVHDVGVQRSQILELCV